MQTFNDSEFSLVGNDGVRMFFDMKGSGMMEILFTGVSWFGMDKISGKEAADRILSCEASSECECKKGIRINFATSGGASICLRIKYDQVKIQGRYLL